MPATPRVMFTSFRSSDEPLLLSWLRFREEIVRAAVLAESGPGHRAGARTRIMPAAPASLPIRAEAAGVIRGGALAASAQGDSAVPIAQTSAGVWRLLATNNRELARSSHAYTTLGDAQSHVTRIRDRVDSLNVVFVLGPNPGMRGWFLTLDGVMVATCGRWYGGAVPCQESSEATLSGLRMALIAETARPNGIPGRRHSRVSAEAERVLAW